MKPINNRATKPKNPDRPCQLPVRPPFGPCQPFIRLPARAFQPHCLPVSPCQAPFSLNLVNSRSGLAHGKSGLAHCKSGLAWGLVIFLMAVLIQSCGLPLVIPPELADESSLASAMTLERTISFSGFDPGTALELVSKTSMFSPKPMVFPVPGGATWLVVPKSQYQGTPAFLPENSTRYSFYTKRDGSTASVDSGSGYYVFCLDQDQSVSQEIFRLDQIKSPSGSKAAAFAWLPSSLLGSSSFPSRFGILGTTEASTPKLRAAMLTRNPDTSTGYPFWSVHILDHLPVFTTRTVDAGLPLPFTLLAGAGTSTRVLAGLDTLAEGEINGVAFAPAREVASGIQGYGLSILANRGTGIHSWFSLVWRGGSTNWYAPSSGTAWWPYFVSVASTLPGAITDLNLPLSSGFTNTGLLALRVNSDGSRDWVLSSENLAVPPATITAWTFNSSTASGDPLVQALVPQPLAGFLQDGSPLAWDGQVLRLGQVDASAPPVIDTQGGWKELSLPGFVFLYEYFDGSSWRLRFCQTLVETQGSNATVNYRILSMERSAYLAWFAARP